MSDEAKKNCPKTVIPGSFRDIPHSSYSIAAVAVRTPNCKIRTMGWAEGRIPTDSKIVFLDK